MPPSLDLSSSVLIYRTNDGLISEDRLNDSGSEKASSSGFSSSTHSSAVQNEQGHTPELTGQGLMMATGRTTAGHGCIGRTTGADSGRTTGADSGRVCHSDRTTGWVCHSDLQRLSRCVASFLFRVWVFMLPWIMTITKRDYLYTCGSTP